MKSQTKPRVCIFARVSTDRQTNDRQILELKEYAERRDYEVVKIIASTISGCKMNRPDLKELLDLADKKMFDKVLVCEVSRLARNKHIRTTIDHLHRNGISVVFKNLGGLESLEDEKETFVTNIVIAVFSEMAAEERNILSDRIKSGLVSARSKGRVIGRPKGEEDTADVLKRYHRLTLDLKNGLSLRACMRIHQCSKGTVIKIKKILSLRKQAA